MIKFLERPKSPSLAYCHLEGDKEKPTIMFLGGFRSDMQGTKAMFLQEFCRENGLDYLRFDYSGHGQSQGKFEEGCIGDWTEDAAAILEHCTSGQVVLVGSSMGGWISFLLAQQYPKRVAGLIGLAAAPDFTTWIEAEMSDDQKQLLDAQGYFEMSNDYDDAPYVITKKLLDEGRQNSVLEKGIPLLIPVHLIQGKQDADVPWKVVADIKKAISGTDVSITYIDEADHRLSSPEQLDILAQILKTFL